MLDMKSFDPKELRNAFGCFATGVTVVTFFDPEGKPCGVTVGSFTSLSLDPPLCLFSLGKDKISSQWIEEHGAFTVNVLACDQKELAWQFATPKDDKFEGVDWTEAANGTPRIEGSVAHFECGLWKTYDGGDHVIVIGQITEMGATDRAPLIFCRGKMATIGES